MVLWGMSLLLMPVLGACDGAQSRREQQEEAPRDIRIVSLQNNSRQLVTKVVILDAHARGSQHRVLYRRELYLQSGVDQIFFLPDVKQCEFIVHVEYHNGQTIDKPAQDFCKRNTLVLDEKDGEGGDQKVAFVASA